MLEPLAHDHGRIYRFGSLSRTAIQPTRLRSTRSSRRGGTATSSSPARTCGGSGSLESLPCTTRRTRLASSSTRSGSSNQSSKSRRAGRWATPALRRSTRHGAFDPSRGVHSYCGERIRGRNGFDRDARSAILVSVATPRTVCCAARQKGVKVWASSRRTTMRGHRPLGPA